MTTRLEDVKALTDSELADLLSFYNLYATSNGGLDSSLVIDGKSMLGEIKRRLRLSSTNPPAEPVLLHLNPLGSDYEKFGAQLWELFRYLHAEGLFPGGGEKMRLTYEYIMRQLTKWEVLRMFDGATVSLSLSTDNNLPHEEHPPGVEIFIPPYYEGWFVYTSDTGKFPGNKFPSKGKLFHNPTFITPNKLDVI